MAARRIVLSALMLITAAAPTGAVDVSHDYAVVERIVYPGQPIEADNVAIRQHTRPIPADFPVLRARADLAGMVANRTLLPGRAVAPDMVRQPHVIEQGGAITVSLEQGALNIAMKAIALQDGAIGEAIRVRNVQNGRTICAIVRSPADAEVC